MRRTLSLITILFFIPASLSLGQAARTTTKKIAAVPDTSKAHAWAEAVTNFLTDPGLLNSFRTNDVAEKFRAVVPPSSVKVNRPAVGDDSGTAPDGNSENGIVGLEYQLADLGNGMSHISWVTIFMRTKDPSGEDVVSRVVASMRPKLRRPWRFFAYSGDLYTWEQRQAFLGVTVQVAESVPNRTDTPGPGPWVQVHLGRVEGFGEP